MRFLVLYASLLLCVSLPTAGFAQVWSPKVDIEFIKHVEGNTVEFDSDDTSISMGAPNCVASVLRAGGFLPYFGLNDPTSFYKNDLPKCFRKIDLANEQPHLGDLGVLIKPLLPELAHAFLFLDEDTVFEKPSADSKDVFRKNSFKAIMKFNQLPFETWRYKGGNHCKFESIHARFKTLPKNDMVRKVQEEIETRLVFNDWLTPSPNFTAYQLRNAQGSNGVDSKSMLNLLLGTPAFKDHK